MQLESIYFVLVFSQFIYKEGLQTEKYWGKKNIVVKGKEKECIKYQVNLQGKKSGNREKRNKMAAGYVRKKKPLISPMLV